MSSFKYIIELIEAIIFIMTELQNYTIELDFFNASFLNLRVKYRTFVINLFMN